MPASVRSVTSNKQRQLTFSDLGSSQRFKLKNFEKGIYFCIIKLLRNFEPHMIFSSLLILARIFRGIRDFSRFVFCNFEICTSGYPGVFLSPASGFSHGTANPEKQPHLVLINNDQNIVSYY